MVIRQDHNHTDFFLLWDPVTCLGLHRKPWGLFGNRSILLVSIMATPKAQLNSHDGEKRSLLVCEHQAVFCATPDSTELAPDAVIRSSLMLPYDRIRLFSFLKECDWIGTQSHLSLSQSPPFPSPVSNILPHLNLMKHLSSAHSNKSQEIETLCTKMT